ncbi:acetoacetyl-CoA synthetase-like [Argiope bruennichi]|uniref:acetoacetyl-CoA synthetase-like n=1 Tax=Argiope bruennichi TaxID=94029 RepID=UPI002495311F|nr:acetoacetyl-CoA synthetase-like [Argiope bruennichi]
MRDLINNCDENSCNNGFINSFILEPTIIWDRKVPDTELDKFKKVIEEKYNKKFDSYWDFHKWTVDNFVDFWKEMFHYFNVIASVPYEKVFVKKGSNILDCEWFPGARLNYAENILRIRDNRTAIICLDEHENEETITFAELYEQVKLYAAAFRKHGLEKGDRVGCYLSNRKEAVFAMLAATSIGAIWGGPLPYYGSRAASNILKMMDPKLVIAGDGFYNYGELYYQLDNLSTIVESLPNLTKLIIVPTLKDTLSKDISNIPKSIFLKDFLERGKTPGGNVPDLVFEQLPFDHPISINFTSGTTGSPKGVVHSAVTFLSLLRDFIFHLNLKSGDVAYSHCAVGWSVWDYPFPTLALGIKQFLFDGEPVYKTKNFDLWTVLSKYKITYAFISTCYFDGLEVMNVWNDHPNLSFDHLKVFTMGASPVKKRNYDFIYKNLKRNDIFIGSQYGATEMFGDFTGFDFNTISYMGECQVPALGVDLQCVDKQGKPVVGQRGEVVVATPCPSFPVCLWGDKGNKRLYDTYLSKYEGVWCQNDEGWINPKTGGIVVIGRSDDIMTQYGELMSAADIYFAIDNIKEVVDYLCVEQMWKEESRVILFVKLKDGLTLTDNIIKKMAIMIKNEFGKSYVPQVILQVPDIPYNLNNKRMESVVRKIVATNKIPEVANIKNPESLKHFFNIPELTDENIEAIHPLQRVEEDECRRIL